MAPDIRPFRIAIPDAALQDLRERLRRTRLPGPVAGAGWGYGTDLAFLGQLIEHWRDRYDWRAEEAALNRMPQFTASVHGTDLHFVHARGRGPAPLPLLFIHGWPGSFWEVHKVLGPLTDPAAHGGDPADAFDVVAPSLPGYGFSPDSGRPGMHPGAMAGVLAALMTETLGYPRFGAQGGDWGASVATRLGQLHAGALAGIHLNLVGARPYLGEGAEPLTEAERAYVAAWERWRRAEGGYQAIQSTKPQTLAFGLTDSPSGLAAWIVEKFRAWSDCGGDVERRFTKDELLLRGGRRSPDGRPRPRRARRGSDRLRPLRGGDHASAAGVGRASVRPAPVERVSQRRPLRGPGGAGAAGRGRARVLPPAA